MWAATSTLQPFFGIAYESYSEASQLFLGAISKIGSRVGFRVCRDCALRFSGFLLPGLTNDDEPFNATFAGFLTEWKILSTALMKNGLKRRPGVASSSERENSRVHLVKLDLASGSSRRQCAQYAPSCSPQIPYAHAIGPSYRELGWREGLQPREGSTVRAKILPKNTKLFTFRPLPL